MGKVKLTREQAEAIGDVITYGTKEEAVESHIEKGWSFKEYLCLNALSTDEFIRALYIGYEVEETFEVGDWVKDTSTNAVIKINDRQHRNNLIDSRHTTSRHATPEENAKEKQRKWWAKHGRGVKELKKGDITKNANGKMIEINHAEQLPDRFKIVCFVEDRKDV